jgi:hypothetical protein
LCRYVYKFLSNSQVSSFVCEGLHLSANSVSNVKETNAVSCHSVVSIATAMTPNQNVKETFVYPEKEDQSKEIFYSMLILLFHLQNLKSKCKNILSF